MVFSRNGYPMTKLNRDGLPVDARDWTRADWQDLHESLEKAKHAISKRYKHGDETGNDPARHTDRGGRVR